MTDNTQADEYLQEQLVEHGDVSSMRYIGDDYTRIVTIREDRLLNIITAYTNKQIDEVLDRFEQDCRLHYTTWGNSEKMLQVSGLLKRIEAERTKLEAEL